MKVDAYSVGFLFTRKIGIKNVRDLEHSVLFLNIIVYSKSNSFC